MSFNGVQLARTEEVVAVAAVVVRRGAAAAKLESLLSHTDTFLLSDGGFQH